MTVAGRPFIVRFSPIAIQDDVFCCELEHTQYLGK
jgi:hypothetical protein